MLWLDTQLLAMGVMFLSGAGIALGLDLLGIVSGHLRAADMGPADSGRRKKPVRRRARLGLWDVLVWMIVTPVVFAAILISNRGEPRLYVFVGLALGLGAYLLLARRLVVWAGATARAAVVRAVGAAGRKVAAPVRSTGARAGKAARKTRNWAVGRGRAFRGWAKGERKVIGGWLKGRRKAIGERAPRRENPLGLLGRRIMAGINRRPKE